ncbi:MAG: FAD-binding oxidoreductase [Rhodoferax sp.]|nr:FAD-binding oxidoreductase [Rhodoferax sp.]
MDDRLPSLRAAFAGRLLTDAADMAAYLTDWRGKWTGAALAVAQPDDATGVAGVLRWCHAHRVPVVPQGGNTGLSGGATPDGSGAALVLSLTRLNRVRHIDAVNNTMVVEAGVTLQQVQDAAREAGRLFPLSLAAQGSCTIGGNLATNAGGVQVLRYGNTRDLCLGLEVATPQGDLWDGLRGLRKDNTGYDLRDLYIGSEGTLGVITAAVLKLFPLPAALAVAFVAVPSPDAAVELLQLCQARLGAALTAFELMGATCIGLVERHVPNTRVPLAEAAPWYVLMEVSDARDESGAQTALEAVLEQALERELAVDAALSASLAQFQSLWALREHISESQAAEGKTIKHDIALPISRIPEFITQTDAAIAAAFPGVRLVVFGHLGDGNLHYNLSPAAGTRDDAQAVADFVALEAPLNRLVHDAVVAHGGSISAEHGLGVLRRDESARYKSPVELQLMQAIKHALDPRGLMNPGKLLDPARVASAAPVPTLSED